MSGRGVVFALAALVTVTGGTPGRAADARPHEVSLQTSYETSAEPLTTERVRKFDLGAENPHRARWALNRDVELDGIRATELAGGAYGVTATVLRAKATAYFRPPGPWYRPLEEFPCTRQPVRGDRFGTLEGARKAAAQAAADWATLLSRDRIKLSVLLQHVSTTAPGLAVEKAQYLFQIWLRQVNDEYREHAVPRARAAEWQYYAESAGQGAACRAGAPSPTWERMMEGLPPVPTPKLLARAPARRWDGLFSIRANITIGARKLNGQFLLDSGAPVSVLSPSFLEAQGILPAWIEMPGVPLEHASWSGALGNGTLARRAIVDGVQMSGWYAPIREFLLAEADFFGPPENLATCCDGILGIDFLRMAAVEISPGPPAELKIWDPIGFALSPDETPWTEVALEDRSLVSSCRLHSEGVWNTMELGRARWDTGNETIADIHLPWQKEARDAGPLWELSCGGGVQARDLSVAFPVPVLESYDHTALSKKDPAFDVGMGFLGRGPVTFDLPHGRLWLSKKALSAPVRENTTGLMLRYVFQNGERALVVDSIRIGSAAEALKRAGLRKGMVVSQIDSKPAEDLDLWEVQRRLAGDYGSIVTLRWDTRKGEKMAPLHVR